MLYAHVIATGSYHFDRAVRARSAPPSDGRVGPTAQRKNSYREAYCNFACLGVADGYGAASIKLALERYLGVAAASV